MFAGLSQIDPVLQLALYDFLLVRQPDFLSSNVEVLQVPTALSARTVRNEAAGSVFLLTSAPSVYSTSRLPLLQSKTKKHSARFLPQVTSTSFGFLVPLITVDFIYFALLGTQQPHCLPSEI